MLVFSRVSTQRGSLMVHTYAHTAIKVMHVRMLHSTECELDLHD